MIYVEHFSISISSTIHAHVPDWIILGIGSTKDTLKKTKSNNKYFLIPYYVRPLPAIIGELFHKIYMAISSSL